MSAGAIRARSDREALERMGARSEDLAWMGDRTIEQAWEVWQRPDRMCWLLRRIAPDDPRCRLAAAAFAERAWRQILDEPSRLAAAWAIDAARRFARGQTDEDELSAAAAAAWSASRTSSRTDSRSACATAAAAACSLPSAAAAADLSRYDAAAAAYVAGYAEMVAQADILRAYFPASEIGRLFREATK